MEEEGLCWEILLLHREFGLQTLVLRGSGGWAPGCLAAPSQDSLGTMFMLKITKVSKATNKVSRISIRWAKTSGEKINYFQKNNEKDILALTQQRMNVPLERNYVN